MTGAGEKKACAVLIGMGSPGSPDDVGQFLYNIFCDRAIIRLPGGRLLQKPMARLISSMRKKKVQEHYALIGGGSPLLKWTQAQADLVSERIRQHDPQFKCFVAMRYFTPYIEEVIQEAYAQGYRDFIFLPMYPQFSRATSGSSLAVARQVGASLEGVRVSYQNDFHDNPEYIELLRSYIDQHIGPDDYLLFTAHSLPQKFVDEGDPYVEQTRATARLVAGTRAYSLSFQSRTGPVKWVGPDTVDETRRLLAEKKGKLFIVPISFLCDHIETLYELDLELPALVGEEFGSRLRRMPMFNDDSRFADCLANIISAKLSEHEQA